MNTTEHDSDRLERKADPLAGRTHADFDWDELYQRMGESDVTVDDLPRLADGLRAIFDWVLSDNSVLTTEFVGRRFLALVWICSPERFEDVSMAKLAKVLGLHRRTMQRLSAKATQAFGVRNRRQAHGWNRAKVENN